MDRTSARAGLAARTGDESFRQQSSEALLLFGALTIVSAVKRDLEGPEALALYWSLAAPTAVALLWIRGRRATASPSWAVAGGAAALLVATFAAGFAAGSSAAADVALGLGLIGVGAAWRVRLLIACGATIVLVTLLVSHIVHEPEATIPLATGLALLAWGIAGRAAPQAYRRPRPPGAAVPLPPGNHSIRFVPLTRSGDRAAAALAAEAFLEDPAMVALSPGGQAARRRLLRRWFQGLLRIARLRAEREPVVALEQGEPVALAVAYEPGTYPAPAWTAALAAPGPALAGPRVSLRALRWLAARDRGHPRYPHVYLETLATASVHRGRGLGTMLLGQLTDEADRRFLPVVLHTNSLRNVRYYARFGFRVERQQRLPHGPTEWLMKRPAASG